MSKKKTVLTGVKPTGVPHIGNYIGAIKPALEMAAAYDESYLFIADYHALNGIPDAAQLREDSYSVAAVWLALGLDTDKTVFYRQSDVPEIFEITSLLTAVTPKGLMDRAHAYKAAAAANENTGRDVDAGVNMGLYSYPILMAADILSMDADLIPVGQDQVQHIEFARDMAGYFNNSFRDAFKLPSAIIQEDGAVLPGLDGRKMSKSYGNHIPVFMDSKKRRKLVMKIVTDSKTPEEPKDPDSSMIFQLYSHYATTDEAKTMRSAFEQGGMGYGDAKQLLFEAIERAFEAPTQLYNDLMADTKRIDTLLADGAEKARIRARSVLSRARQAVGLTVHAES